MRFLIDLLVDSLKELAIALLGSLFLMGSIGGVIGSMFGIAYLAEKYGTEYLLLFIPFFLILSVISTLLKRGGI